MELQQIEKTKMDTIKALADMSLKISQIRNELSAMEETETEYLVQREEKASKIVKDILAESNNLLEEAFKNYEKTHKFCKTTSDYADFLTKVHQDFKEILKISKEKDQIWEENFKKQTAELARQRKIIEQDAVGITEREDQIKEAVKGIKKEKEYIESQRQSLTVAYQAEKALWDKLHK